MLIRIKKYNLLRIVALVVALGLSCVLAAQSTITVGPVASRADIQAALNAVGPGGTVYIQGGPFNLESTPSWEVGPAALTLPAGVSLVGVGDTQVVFNLSGGARLFNVMGSSNPNHVSRIENIRMTGTSTVWHDGAAIHTRTSGADTARLELNNVHISMTAGNRGGAIFADAAHITIRNSNIMNNNAHVGGAFHLTNSFVQVFNSRIGNNGAVGAGVQQGGAFWISGGYLFIQRSQLFNNVTGGTGQGGAIFIGGSNTTVVLDHCDVVNNTSINGGSAFFICGVNNTLTLTYSTISQNDNTGGGAAGAFAICGADNTSTVNIRSSIVSGNSNASGEHDDDVDDNPNISIDNSVIGDDFVVSNDPNHECLPVGCNDSVPDGSIRCVYCDIFRPGDIVVGDSGATSTPPIIFPDGEEVEVGSGGGATATLVLIIANEIICPAGTIQLTVNQTNMQNVQLWRVDQYGNNISLVGSPTTATVLFTVNPIFGVPVMFFQARGRSQDGNNPWIYTELREALILPFVTSDPIDHVRNIPPIEP